MNILNFIGGKFCEGEKGEWLDNVCPATGQVYSKVVASGVEDVRRACEAADLAFDSWKKTEAKQRASLLRELGHLVQRDLKSLALAESKDQGKTLEQAEKGDLPRVVKNFEFFSDYALKLSKERFRGEGGGDNHISHHPLGVVAAIVPWNLPLYLLTWKLAPALAMGNCVVAKPSELTPMTAFLFCKLVQEAGFPPGVVNVIHGEGARMGDALTTHPKIKAVSFTGSTQTGTHIHKVAAESGHPLKKISLEMGGKNPNIIFADCDLERTLEATLRSSFANQGEVCTCGPRVFVEKDLYEDFKRELLVRIPGFPQGALVSEAHLQKVMDYVALAQREGGRILCGGKRKEGPGFYLGPTVIEGLDRDSPVNREEIFGPVITLTPFETEEKAILLANSVDYGLSATIHTRDLERARRVAQALEVGMVWINDWMKRDLRTPFGGVKRSGLGREGGQWALHFYTEAKNICYPETL
ncbi:MAG: aldehyde dehydrogenase [Bacteriovoracales bacterium]|nr:aldehyde dehydrogenase [Bacteriovoracales bacterium]